MAIVPITNVALGTLAAGPVKNASGLFNLMRNLGGAVGLAALNTVLNDRMDLHLARLHEAVNWSRRPAAEMLATLTARFHDFGFECADHGAEADDDDGAPAGAGDGFADVFLMLTVLFAVLAVLGIVMKRPAAVAGGGGPLIVVLKRWRLRCRCKHCSD